MPVEFMRRELMHNLSRYELIDDCVAGEEAVKARGTRYLPQPNARDKSDRNQDRYEAYRTRAVFYNVAGRTLGGLVGQVFGRPPQVTLPPVMAILGEDCTGTGIDLIQQAKACVELVCKKGRGGLHVGWTGNGAATPAEISSGAVSATINRVDAQDILNWRYSIINGKKQLSLVVFREEDVSEKDEFSTEIHYQFRECRWTPEGVFERIWPAEMTARGTAIPRAGNPTKVFLKDAAGKAITELPFKFIGSVSNDATIDPAPMYDICVLNIGHFRNSADYEDACYLRGQPTIFITGLTPQWIDEVLKGKVYMGDRAAVPLPVNSTVDMIQADANSMPFEAMQHKEKQMVALGARLVENRSVQRTATEVGEDTETERSVLSTIADNVSDAFEWALYYAGKFYGIETTKENTVFRLESQFELQKLSPEEIRQVVELWAAGGISFTEMRAAMRRAAYATQEDKEAQKEIKDNPPPRVGEGTSSTPAGPKKPAAKAPA